MRLESKSAGHLSSLQVGRTARNGISLTPLIDVVFILLVFFMLTTSFLDWRTVKLKLPVVGASTRQALIPVVVTLTLEGVRLDGRDISDQDLITQINIRRERQVGQPVVIRPAKEVSIQRVVGFLDVIARARIDGVQLVRSAP